MLHCLLGKNRSHAQYIFFNDVSMQKMRKSGSVKAWFQTHIEGLHGNMRHFVVDSLHNGSQAVLWPETEENRIEVNACAMDIKQKTSGSLQ